MQYFFSCEKNTVNQLLLAIIHNDDMMNKILLNDMQDVINLNSYHFYTQCNITISLDSKVGRKGIFIFTMLAALMAVFVSDLEGVFIKQFGSLFMLTALYNNMFKTCILDA